MSSEAPPASPPTTPAPARTTSYGDDPAQVYDVREPTTPGPTPGAAVRGVTVVVVHGGFWRATYDREHAGPQAQGLADRGFHVAVVEYRRVTMPGGGWPGTFDDVSAAIAAVRADATLPEPTVLL
ncbi:MAG: alpha/beta hydrolase, partial [Actinomycetota bacterium]|nr:alpha/beta hydrolase [Actinomycetota bacterium]